jgi:hypothetical protein
LDYYIIKADHDYLSQKILRLFIINVLIINNLTKFGIFTIKKGGKLVKFGTLFL